MQPDWQASPVDMLEQEAGNMFTTFSNFLHTVFDGLVKGPKTAAWSLRALRQAQDRLRDPSSGASILRSSATAEDGGYCGGWNQSRNWRDIRESVRLPRRFAPRNDGF